MNMFAGVGLLRWILVSVLWAVTMSAQAVATVPGFVNGELPDTVDEAVEQIKAKLIDQNCKVYRVIDHAANARKVGLDLPDTKVILFSSNLVDDYVIGLRQLSALDLPQKILVRMGPDRKVRIDSKPASRLYSRYGIKIGDRYARMMENKARQFNPDAGILTFRSTRDFNTTVADLVSAIANTEGFLVAGDPIDYTVAAQRPTKLVIAGSPLAGTRLMQARGSIGLDLPLKLLVWQDENNVVRISYNDPAYLARTYDITTADNIFANMTARLCDFSMAAGGVAEVE